MSRFFNIQTDAEGVCTIFLYGDIGDYYEVQSGRVARELLEAEKAGSRIHVRINSNGGDVYCGIAIYNAIKNSKADVHIYVDGIAASMASVIALCGKPVEMSKYARLMLHSVSGGCYGNKKEMQKCIEEIESLEDSLGDIYAARLGMTKEEVKAIVEHGHEVGVRVVPLLNAPGHTGTILGNFPQFQVADDSGTNRFRRAVPRNRYTLYSTTGSRSHKTKAR